MTDYDDTPTTRVIGRVPTAYGWQSYAIIRNPGELPCLSIRAERHNGSLAGRVYVRGAADLAMLRAALAELASK